MEQLSVTKANATSSEHCMERKDQEPGAFLDRMAQEEGKGSREGVCREGKPWDRFKGFKKQKKWQHPSSLDCPGLTHCLFPQHPLAEVSSLFLTMARLRFWHHPALPRMFHTSSGS